MASEWACSHEDGEECRCDELLTCICDACCEKRWPRDSGAVDDAVLIGIGVALAVLLVLLGAGGVL